MEDINNILVAKKFIFETLYTFSCDEDYEKFELMMYNGKIKYLDNYLILIKYGLISLEFEYNL